MNFTLRILELYQLNLWSREGNEYFSFTKSPEFKKQSQSRKQRRRRRRAQATRDAASLKVPISEERLVRILPAVAGVPQETSGHFKPVRTIGRPTETFQSGEIQGDSQTYGETRGDSPVVGETSSDTQDLGVIPKNPQVRHEKQKDSLVSGDTQGDPSVRGYIPGDSQSRGKS